MSSHVELDTSGMDDLLANGEEWANATLRALAEEMVGDIKLSMGTSPSAPGGPPGVDTGALRASIHWYEDNPLRLIIADGVLYGIHLELGTERMAARPFMTPVFEKWRKQFPDFVRERGFIK